ncbi:MAG: SMC-Scp complex subunit ScpB [Terracidiphilus sp.]|nr:SMC-Scp complex subunit ScpB [Terracidiphilus sp.]
MSLKAKLEAVIYAAEEPVTLTQLAALFAADALEWKAEQDAASAEQADETANQDTVATEPLLNETFDYNETDQAEAVPAPPEPSGSSEPAPEVNPEDEVNPETGTEAETGPEAESGAEPDATEETGPEAHADAEALAAQEAKRQARQRDREVRAILRQLLDELIANYAADSRGVEIREIAGGYRMATKPECHDAVRLFVKSLKPALRLSLPALETLAVVAYKQPVTAPEVNEIRGVDSSGVFGSLLARKLIATAGRKPVIGRPILYKTTREFLLRFGLKDVSELPSMEEFEKMAALELEEPEVVSEGESAPEIRQDSTPESPEPENQELAESDDQPGEEFYPPEQESSEPTETAGTAASNEPHPPAEAAPAAPPATEQAETENSPHD